MAHSFCTAIGCKCNHSHEKITFSGDHKYRIKEFYEITCCYVKERMDICSFCTKCVNFRKVLNITFFCDSIYERNRKRDDCISHVVVRWHCFKHKFCRICLDTAGTMCVPFPYSQEHANQKWLLKKEKRGLI